MKTSRSERSNSLPLLERARVEIYVPDLPAPHYRKLLLACEKEFTYTFGRVYDCEWDRWRLSLSHDTTMEVS